MSLKSVVVALLLLLSGIPTNGEDCYCKYEVVDEGECKSASKTAAGELVQWSTADDGCLAALNVSRRLLPSANFWVICPNPNRTGVDNQELVQLLMNDPKNPVAQDLMEEFSDRGLFEVTDDDTWDLAENITTPMGVTINCTNTPGLCWSQVNEELAGRVQKMDRFCKNTKEAQIQAYQEEQAEARVKLCANPRSDPCEPLNSEVAASKTSVCSQLGTTVDVSELPNCTAANAGDTSGACVGSTLVSVGLIIVSLFM